MAGRKKKSKKQSAANSKQRKQIVFYVDRNLDSKIVPKALRKAGVNVEIHDDHLAQDAADEEWIELVGRKKWVAITKDRNIQHRIAEHFAIIQANARVYVLRAKDVTGEQSADILIKYIHRLENYAEKHEPPFLAGIDRNGKITSYKLKPQ